MPKDMFTALTFTPRAFWARRYSVLASTWAVSKPTSAMIRTSGAMPEMPYSSCLAAMMPAQWLPCSPWSLMFPFPSRAFHPFTSSMKPLPSSSMSLPGISPPFTQRFPSRSWM